MSKFIGFRHFNGVSKKTGNSYDFFQCHFVNELSNADGNADGYSCDTVSVSPEVFYRNDMADKLNHECKIYYNGRGYVEDVVF